MATMLPVSSSLENEDDEEEEEEELMLKSEVTRPSTQQSRDEARIAPIL